jgi:glycosyltransferase involved in cell wall biosynthesis
MAMGLPVVVSNIPIFREVVGEHGIFVEPGSSREIAKAIQWIGEDVSRAKSIGEANRRRALSLFDIRRTAESYVSFYRSRMGRPDFAAERR